MKNINLNKNLILVLVTTVLLASGVAAQAEENGFTLENSIRNEIFLELKSNVENLYQSNQWIVPEIDTRVASRIVSNRSNSGFVIPVNRSSEPITKDNAVENIN
jgi:hypothetical protein